MIASVLIGLGIFFFLFVPFGIYTNIFLIYGIGLTGAGLSFVFFSIVVKNSWRGFKRFKRISYNLSIIMNWLHRLFTLGIGLLALYGASAFWLDLPAYIDKDYSRLEGIPTKLAYEKSSKGGY